MRTVIVTTLMFAIIAAAAIGCLMIFEVFTFDHGMEILFKSLAAIILLGATSAAIVYVTAGKKTSGE